MDKTTLNNRLITACRIGQLPIVKKLVEIGANIHARDNWALRWAAHNGHLNVVKYLVEKGADVHAGYSCALIRAVSNGYLNVAKYLVENGADLYTLQQYASYTGDSKMLKFTYEIKTSK